MAETLRIIDRTTTLSLMDFDALIASAERAYVAQSNGDSAPPAYINLPVGENFAHFKAGYIKGGPHFALKYSGGFFNSGSPEDLGYVIVHRSDTGKPDILFYDGGVITDYRTAAAGAAVAKHFSRENSAVVGLIGTGIQARLQIEALTHVRSIHEVRVWGRSIDKVEQYIHDMSSKLCQVRFTPCDTPERAVRQTDIVVTVTPSHQPIVQADWITPGMHITAVGACGPDMQEHDPKILAKARVFADSVDKCLEDGEIHHALDQGVLTKSQIGGEIGQVISGSLPGRTSDSDITFVDLVGIGVQDLTAAECLLQKLATGVTV